MAVTPSADIKADSPTSPGHVLGVLRAEGPLTRQELQERVGLSRATMVERLDVLHRLDLLRQTGHRQSSGGRRAEVLAANDVGRTAVVADIGQSHATVAVADLAGNVFASADLSLPARHTPGETVPQLLAAARRLLAETERADSLCAVALSVPGQIDHDVGTTIAPPTIPAWQDFPLREPFAEAFGTPVLLENDANALALGDYYAMRRPDSPLVGIKVGTAIGAGVVIAGKAHRGETGCAGEIGHIRIEGNDERCSCGRRGCVSALASGLALVRKARPAGVRSVADLVRRVHDGRPDVVQATADAGRLLGAVLATVVTIVNPRYVRVGGAIGVLPPFLTAMREVVHANAHTSALKSLDIETSALGENGGVVGLAGLAADEMLAPSTVDSMARTS